MRKHSRAIQGKRVAWSSKSEQSKERQNELAIRAKGGDQDAMDELIRITLPIAISQVKRINFSYYKYAAPQGKYSDVYDELRQEAMLGLVEAVWMYDPSRNVKFWTFAYYRVQKRISLWLAHNSGTVPMPHEAWRTAKMVDEAEDHAGEDLSAHELKQITGKGYARTAADARNEGIAIEPEHMIEPDFTEVPLDEIVLGFVYSDPTDYAIEEFCEEHQLPPNVYENMKEVVHENRNRPRTDERSSVANRRGAEKSRNRRG